jgi:hypothetical protein
MRQVRVVLSGLVVLVAWAGCSSDATEDGGAVTTTAPEDRRASDAEVAAGLEKIAGIATDIAGAAGTDTDRATALADGIEPVWQEIEGTIKANDEDTYLAFEDAFAVLEGAAADGDAAAAGKGAAAVTEAKDTYLAAHPG